MAVAKTRYISEYVIDTARAVGPASEIDRKLKGVDDSAKGAKSSLLGIGASAAGLWLTHEAITAIGNRLRDWGVQEQAIEQVEAAIESTGGVAGLTLRELEAMAEGLQDVTTFGDEVTLMASSQLLTFTKINRDVFPRTIELAQDMSIRMDQDLKGSVIQLGKALNDPIKGVSALADVGVQFTEDQRNLIESLIESNDILGAQTVILEELETQFGGSARAARATATGAFTALSNASTDLSEVVGKKLAFSLSLVTEELTDLVKASRDWLSRGDDVERLLDELAPRAEEASVRVGNLVDEIVRSAEIQAALDDYKLLTEELERQEAALEEARNGTSDLALVQQEKLGPQVLRLREAVINAAEKLREVAAAAGQAEEAHSGGADAAGHQARSEDELTAALERQEKVLSEARDRLSELTQAHRERLAVLRDEQRTIDRAQGLVNEAPVPFDATDLEQNVTVALEGAAAESETAFDETLGELLTEDVPSRFEERMQGAGRTIAENWRDVIGQAVGQMLSVLLDDALNDTRPVGRFGGRLSSDLSEEFGSILGGAGSVLGGLALGPVGSALGGALGGILGSVIGGAIKHGADRGVGQLQQIGDDVALMIERDEGGLGAVLEQISGGIRAGIDSLERLLGGQIDLDPGGGGGLGIKVADDKISLFFAGQIHTFETIEEAVKAGIALIVRYGEVSEGTSPEVQQALQNFTGRSFEDLQEAVELAVRLEAERLGPEAAGVRDRVRAVVADLFGAIAAGISPEGGLAALGRAKDEILGIQLSQEEALKRRAEAYNLEVDLLEASLRAQLAELEAKGQLLITEEILTRDSLDLKQAYVEGLGHVVGATGAAANAITAIAGILAQLDDLRISSEELAAAGRRIRGSGGGVRNSQREAERQRRRNALRELEILEALAAGNDERVEALEREARLQELIASGLNASEAARRLELEAIIEATEAAESARAALENLEILEARAAGNHERADAIEREARILQLVASGLTEVQAARQLELEAILNAEDALRSLEILEARAAGDDERVAALEREIRMQELVASGLSEVQAARQLELEAIIAAAEAAEAAEPALRDLAILEARAAGDDKRVAALEREIRLLDLVARGLSDVQAERYLELEAEIAAGEAAAAAAEEFNELADSLSERAAGAIQGPSGLAGRAAAIIESIVSLQDEILEALEGQEPRPDKDLPENVRLLLEQLDELDAELDRQLHALGDEALADFGSRLLGLRLETRRTANDIRFLLDNLEELGVSAADVAQAVREGVLPDLLAIGEAQAQRVGDEEALARLTERRQQLELLFERVRFESMVATLRLAGALDEEMQALVLDVRRLFLLPDAPPEATTGGPTATPQQVSQVARLREELTGIIEASERSQLGSARQQLESIFDTFARAGSLLKAVSASASDWTRTAQAMATELRSFWRGLVLDPAQDRLDALRQARQTPAQQFMAARQAFEGLNLGGLSDLSDLDPDQVQEIFQVLDRFQEAGVAQFGEGFGQTVVGRQVEAALEQLVGLVPDEEDLLLQAIQHLEEQTAARLDDIRGSVGAEGPIVLALTETGVAAEIRQLAEQIDDAAIAGGLEALATALENGEIGLDDASLLLALDELRDQLDPGSPLELQISGLIDQLASGLELNDVIIVGLDALRDTLDVDSPLYAQMGTLIDSMVAGDLTSAELLAGLYALRDQLDPGSPLEAELAALIAELEAGLTFEEVTIAGLLDLQRALDSDSPLHTQLGALIDQMVNGDLTSIELLAGLYSLRDQLDPGSPLESELAALINELEGGLTFEEVTIAGLLQLQQTLDEGSPLHSQLGALIDQLFAGEISGAETVLALDELRDQLDPGSPLETEISNLIREYREGLDINDLIVVGLDDLQDALEEGSPLHRQLGGLIEQLLAGEISTAETILALDDLRDQLDPGSPLEMEISNLIREYREGLDINDLVILGLDDLRDALDENSPLHQQLGGLIDQLLAGEMSAADTILALYGLRDELDAGSPLLQELDGLIAQLAAGVAVDTGNLGDTLLGLSELLGVEGNSAAELLQDIAEELLAGTLTIDDHDLLSRLQGVIAELGEDHPLHSVLASVWETLGGGSGGAPEPIASLLRGDQWGGVGHYTKETWRRLGVDGTIARQLTPSVFGGTGYYAKETFELLGDIGSDVAAIAEAVAPSGMRTDPGADLMHELWGERSPVIARLDQISTQLGQLSESANMRAGGI